MTEEPKQVGCNATVANKRCDWRGTREELQEHAEETTHKLCRLCTRSLKNAEPVVCDKCVQQTRDDLRGIAATFGLLGDIIEHSGYHGIAFDALTLAADGSLASPQRPDGYTHPVESKPTAHVERPEIEGQPILTTWRGQPWLIDTTHPAFTEDRKTPDGREHVKDHWPTDPTPVIAVLEVNERDWRHEFGHGPAVDIATVESCSRYLLTWLALAARTHPCFEEFAREVHALASQLEHVIGVADDPVIAGGRLDPIRCFDCKTGRLIRRYRPPVEPVTRLREGLDVEGLPDEYDCDHCGSIYDHASYYLAVRAALEAQRALAHLTA